MNKLLPLLALVATGCGGELEVIDVSLEDLPHPSFHAELKSLAGGEDAWIQPEQDVDHGPCHRIPRDSRLTANGRELKLESPGGSTSRGFLVDHASCREPYFDRETLPDEPRTEFILSDGHTQRRAVFQALRTTRHFLVNSQQQGTVKSGKGADLEWFPATDQLERVEIQLRAEGSREIIQTTYGAAQGNHIYVDFVSAPPGRYVLTAWGVVKAGVEACEGFISCDAPLTLVDESQISVPVTVE